MTRHMQHTIRGESGEWEVVIGLEVHAQVTSQAKLFSGAATAFGAEPNTQVSLVDAAMPGMLPVINGHCVEQAIKTGLGLKAQINRRSVFDRKNYFYADLPAGYQISQYLQPIVGKGEIVLDLPDGRGRTIAITRLHLEMDAGKSLHDQHPSQTYIDLNRAGVALMEIVSEPDLRTAEEAGAYLRKLRSILRYLGTCDGNMEEGSMRCDCNVSVRRPGDELGTRTETKNVNSVRFVMQAIEHEARRQIGVLESGGTIQQETLLFDPATGTTRPMRSKEHAHDYRYFPDPDLLPLELSEAEIARIEASLPELPDDKKKRFMERYGLSAHQASIYVEDADEAKAYEEKMEKRFPLDLTENEIKDVVVYISGASIPGSMSAELITKIHTISGSTANLMVTSGRAVANNIGQSSAYVFRQYDWEGLDHLIYAQEISVRQKKEVIDEMVSSGKKAAAIVEEKGLRQVSDTGALDAAIAEVLAGNADKVAEFKSGKDKLFGFFVGQVMKMTGGKANPGLVNELLRKKLSS